MDQKTHHSFVSTSPSMDVMSYVMLEPFLLTSELLARIWQAAPANTTTWAQVSETDVGFLKSETYRREHE